MGRAPVNRWLAVPASLAIVCVSTVLLLRSRNLPAEREFAAPFEQMGCVLAKETVRVLGGRGRIVVLRTRVAGNRGNPVLGAASEAFAAALKQSKDVEVVASEEEEYNPLEQEEGWKRTTMESSRFAAFLRKHRDADAVVLLGGTPMLNRKDLGALPAPRPRIVCASVLTMPARWLLAENVIDSAIVLRPGASTTRTPPATPEEAFERRYMVVRAENAGVIP